MLKAVLSPEAVMIFAFLEARCRVSSRKQRDEFLGEIAAVLAEWAEEPVSFRRPSEHEAKETALEWFREQLPRLIG